MSAEITDAQVRQQALDPTGSFIVQAPAGSGKTELLTRRILTLLARVDEPEEILAITFTRKAASEMRQRVVKTLREADQGLPVEDTYQREGRALAEAVLRQDQQRNWQLLENPSRLAMQTIDSLCAVLTRQLPVTANFGAPLNVLEDSRRLFMLAAERCIENNLRSDEPGYHALCQLLALLDNNVERLQKLLADMLGNRDQWLRHYRQAGSREKLESDLAELVSARFDELSSVLPLSLLQGLPALLRYAAHNLTVFDIDSPVLQLADLEQIPTPTYTSGTIWQLLADFLVTNGKNGNFRKSLTRNVGFPSSSADAAELDCTPAELKAHKKQMQEILNDLREIPGLEALLKEVRELPLSGYTDEQWQTMGSLLELLSLSVAELHFVFAEHATVDFTETALRAATALGDEQAPTDLALALDYKLKHILVDEFQDTSISQDALFRKLVAGWEPGDGRTFFAVGDPMQSIYRFRDAEVSLFLRASQSGIGEIALIPLQLEVNFRSDQAVVDWCNSTFSEVFPTKADLTSGAVTYAYSTPYKLGSAQSGQHFHAFVDTDRATRADWVAELVAAALDPPLEKPPVAEQQAGSVAILVRSKSELPEIFVALQQRKIDYQAVDIETLGDRMVVRDILSLCRALLHPQDRIHWLAVLRAPWCGLSLQDLHALVDAQPLATIWSLVCDKQRRELLSADGQQRLQRLHTALEPALARTHREPLLPWVESLWMNLGGPASCQFSQDLLAADACFVELAAIEQAGLLYDSRLIDERMGKLFAPAMQGQDVRVQIMTIHKSKGLEFDTVILPALERQPRADATRLLNWFEYFGQGSEARLLLAPISETNISSESAAPIVKLVSGLQNQKSANELIRLLYVAATRAKRHLHLLGGINTGVNGEIKAPNKKSLLAPLWPLVQALFEQVSSRQLSSQEELQNVAQPATAVSEDTATVPVNATPLLRIRQSWPVPDFSSQWVALDPAGSLQTSTLETASPVTEDSEDPLIFDWASASARHIGSVVHRQLQRISDEGVAQWSVQRVNSETEFYRSLLKIAGVADQRLDGATAQVVKALSTVLSDTRGQWVMSDAHREVFSEYRLTGVSHSAQGEAQLVSGVIDRTFIDDNDVRWIIDFKTGTHKGKNPSAFLDREELRYRAQLERYAGIMQALDNRQIRLGLYFPLLSGWREWPYNAA